jgi:tetratricopeptide (TPR) repeat protein
VQPPTCLASILGREFDPDVLARIADVSADDLLDTLDAAMAARVVSDIPGARGRLRFAHVLIRDTLYEGLTTARRVRLHRQIVAALEMATSASDAELAYHSIAGSEFEKGVGYATRAGDRALALLAWEEAVRLYDIALEALELAAPDDEGMRCELVLSLGEARSSAGDSAGAKAAFLEAAELARRLGHGRDLGRAAAGYGGRIFWVRAGRDDKLVALLEEALAAIPDDDVELRTRLLGRLAGALRDDHSRERRDQLSREAVELARRMNNPGALSLALAGRAHAIEAADTVSECLAIGDELYEAATRVQDLERVIASHSIRILSLVTIGEMERAESELASASRLAQDLGRATQRWDSLGQQAMLALAKGELARGERLMEEAFAIGKHALPEASIPIYWLQRYVLGEFRGGIEDVEPELSALADEYPARPVFRCALAHLHARLGRIADAERALRELAPDDCADVPFEQEWLYAMSLLAETAALLRDTGSAESLYAAIEPWRMFAAVDVAEGFRGSMSRGLGQLAALLGRTDDAARHFEDAIAMNGRMGARPWLAYTQHDYARLLESRNPERAAALLAAARATYAELGMREPD